MYDSKEFANFRYFDEFVESLTSDSNRNLEGVYAHYFKISSNNL